MHRVQYRPAVHRSGKSLAENMLRGYDEAATLDKLAAQRELEDMIEEDGAASPAGIYKLPFHPSI